MPDHCDTDRRGTMDRATAEAIYEILIVCCGASELSDERDAFVDYLTKPIQHGHEYRFGGWLGFGGKLYANSQGVYVDCYSEQKSPIVAFAIRTANERIDAALATPSDPSADEDEGEPILSLGRKTPEERSQSWRGGGTMRRRCPPVAPSNPGDPTDRKLAEWHAISAGAPTEAEVEAAARAMQAMGRDRWRGKEWTGKAWRVLDWDEVREDERPVVLALARAALQARHP